MLFFGFKVLNLNSLSKILGCGADDMKFYFRFMFMSICFVDLFFIHFGFILLFGELTEFPFIIILAFVDAGMINGEHSEAILFNAL